MCEVKEHVIDSKVVEVKRAIPRSRLSGGSSPSSSSTSSASKSTTRGSITSQSTSSSANSGSKSKVGAYNVAPTNVINVGVQRKSTLVTSGKFSTSVL